MLDAKGVVGVVEGVKMLGIELLSTIELMGSPVVTASAVLLGSEDSELLAGESLLVMTSEEVVIEPMTVVL